MGNELEEFIVRDEAAAQAASEPEPVESYEHTPTLRELRAAYVTQQSQAFFDHLGPRPHGVPQGPEHAEAEFDRALRALTPEAIEQHFEDEEVRRG